MNDRAEERAGEKKGEKEEGERALVAGRVGVESGARQVEKRRGGTRRLWLGVEVEDKQTKKS